MMTGVDLKWLATSKIGVAGDYVPLGYSKSRVRV